MRALPSVSGSEWALWWARIPIAVRLSVALRPPVAGLCIDKVGARADVCAGRLDWHDSVGASAPIVNQVGRAVISAALELENPGYRFGRRPFVSTPETLVGDPKYGLPCHEPTSNTGTIPG